MVVSSSHCATGADAFRVHAVGLVHPGASAPRGFSHRSHRRSAAAAISSSHTAPAMQRSKNASSASAAHSSSSIACILSDAPLHVLTLAGASAHVGAGSQAHQKGSLLIAHRAFTFDPSRLVQQLVHRLYFPMEAPMEQRQLRLFERIEGAAVVPPHFLVMAKTYREAVRFCWELRRAKGMKATDMARDFGFTRQHVSDYLNADDKSTRRSLPAEDIATFEEACGNTFVTQWLNARAHLTCLEEMQAERMAA